MRIAINALTGFVCVLWSCWLWLCIHILEELIAKHNRNFPDSHLVDKGQQIFGFVGIPIIVIVLLILSAVVSNLARHRPLLLAIQAILSIMALPYLLILFVSIGGGV